MELEIRKLIGIVRRRGWVVIAATVLGGVLALMIGLLQDETYAADARLLVLPAGGARDSYNALLTSQNLAETYRQMMESEPMYGRVIESLDLDLTPVELEDKMASAVLPGMLLIEVSVEDEDPERAALIATTFVEQFGAYIDELSKVDIEGGGLAADVEVSDPATVPEDPVAPRLVVLGTLGAFAGLLLGLGMTALLELQIMLRSGRTESARTAEV